MKEVKLFYNSEKVNGVEHLAKENLYKCTEKCYTKFKTDGHVSYYKKSDIREKIDGQWYVICKTCKSRFRDNTGGVI